MSMKIGWSIKDISLDEPMSLPGQAILRISEGILDPVCVTALCIDGGEGKDKVIFLSVDTLAAMAIEDIDERARKRCPDLPHYVIVMNGTHTHTTGSKRETPEKSPDGKDIYPGLKYREFMVDKCAEAVCEAWENRTEGGVSYGYGYAVVAHSRRVVYFDDTSLRGFTQSLSPNGHGVMYGNTNDPMFSHYEAGADHFLNAMFTYDLSGKVTGVVVNVPCPSQVSEMLTVQSADFWHDVRVAVRKEFGEDVFVLPQCAAAGDLSPRILHYKDAQARRMKLKYGLEYDPKGSQHQFNKGMAERKDIAERILEGLKDIYSWSKKEILTDCPVRHIHRKMELSKRLVTEEEKQWCENKIKELEEQVPDPNFADPEEYRKKKSRYDSIKNRNTRVLNKYEAQKTDKTLELTVHAVQIGEISFATNRFELYQDFQHRIQARSPFTQTFIIQLGGDNGGTYLPTIRGVANKGYSACIFDNQVGPEGGQQLVENTLDMLNELYNRED